MKIVVGSMNPVKINLVKRGFNELFGHENVEVIGFDAPSDVSKQPISSNETLNGAKNRTRHSKVAVPEADYWVGVEGGIEDQDGVMQEYTWIYLISKDGKESKSRSASFTIPPQIAAQIRNGVEFGPASDQFFGKDNLKQGTGTIGMISDNLYTRETYPLSAVVFAFLPFKHPEYYEQ
jgi:inosine/xanthosine triphosphatase